MPQFVVNVKFITYNEGYRNTNINRFKTPHSA
jgi:hypothetical protein